MPIPGINGQGVAAVGGERHQIEIIDAQEMWDDQYVNPNYELGPYFLANSYETGDLQVVFFSMSQYDQLHGYISAINGWTLAGTYHDAVDDIYLAVFYKFATSNKVAHGYEYCASFPSWASSWIGGAMCFQYVTLRNVDPANPIEHSPVFYSESSGHPNPGAISVVNNGSIVLVHGHKNIGNVSGGTSPHIDAFDSRLELIHTGWNSNSFNDHWFGLFAQRNAPPGSIDYSVIDVHYYNNYEAGAIVIAFNLAPQT